MQLSPLWRYVKIASPLESYASKILSLHQKGLNHSDIARQLQESGVHTTRHSVKRFLEREVGACSPVNVGIGQTLRRRAVENDSKDAKPFWGFGGPATLDLPKKTGSYTVVGLFDLHGEYREEKLFQAQLRHIMDVSPDLVVLGGDIDNFDIISRWQHKILSRMSPIQILKAIKKEIDDGKRIRDRVREAMERGPGSSLLVEVEGNHGSRLRQYLSDDLNEGWETSIEWRGLNDSLDGYYTRAGVFIRPDFLVRHGDTTAKYAAAKEYRDSRCSGWTGHLHNIDIHAEPPFHLKNERYIHTIAPASCRLDYNYGSGNATLARWHQGNLIGSFSASDPHDHVTDIGLWNGKNLRVRGNIY